MSSHACDLYEFCVCGWLCVRKRDARWDTLLRPLPGEPEGANCQSCGGRGHTAQRGGGRRLGTWHQRFPEHEDGVSASRKFAASASRVAYGGFLYVTQCSKQDCSPVSGVTWRGAQVAPCCHPQSALLAAGAVTRRSGCWNFPFYLSPCSWVVHPTACTPF